MLKKIKIIHIQLFPLMSGVQKVTLDELIHLDSNLFERIVVCKCEGEFTDRLKIHGIRVYIVPELRREIAPISDFLAFLHLRFFLMKECPDIVHTHSSKTGVLGRLAARSAKVRCIIHTVHGFSFSGESNLILRNIFKLLERFAAYVSSKIIVLTNSDAEIAKKTLGIPDKKVSLIPNGVDFELYYPPPAELRNNLRNQIFSIKDHSHLVVAMIGRLSEQKNPHCFLRAAISVVEKNAKVSFVFIGDGELRKELEEMIQKSRIGKRVFILGWRIDVPNILRSIDLMVLPSRWEGMPLAILESMAMGVPVIASDIPGNNALVSNRVDGRLFSLNDDTSLAKTIEDLINDPMSRAIYASNARSKVMAHYSLKSRIRTVSMLYTDLLR